MNTEQQHQTVQPYQAPEVLELDVAALTAAAGAAATEGPISTS